MFDRLMHNHSWKYEKRGEGKQLQKSTVAKILHLLFCLQVLIHSYFFFFFQIPKRKIFYEL